MRFSRKHKKRLSREARELVIDSLGKTVDLMHATARNMQRDPSITSAVIGRAMIQAEREAADYLSGLRQTIQRETEN